MLDTQALLCYSSLDVVPKSCFGAASTSPAISGWLVLMVIAGLDPAIQVNKIDSLFIWIPGSMPGDDIRKEFLLWEKADEK